MSAAARVEDALQALDVGHRRVAAGEWGFRVASAGGWPLDVGLALHQVGSRENGRVSDLAGRSLLRAQAEVCGPGQIDASDLLHRNRRTPLVAFGCTLAGVVWIEGWLPVAGLTAGELDRLLGMLVAAATDVRELVASG